MQHSVVDEVPVFWEQGPAPLSAGLCFRAGLADETFASGGLTHLVEHLVMGALPKSHVDRNASVQLDATEFTATGEPEHVVQFLAQVCALLSDLPLDRLATEARVLMAEEASSGGGVLGELMLRRYGARGFGLTGMVEPAVGSLTHEQVRAHVCRRFTTGNAALWLTGPPPAGLRLNLPAGPPVDRPTQARLPLRLPAQARYAGSDVALSFEGPPSEALACGLRIVLDRMQDALRHRGGHSYAVDFVADRVDSATAHVAFFADAPETELAAVANGLYEQLQRFAQDGPTTRELAHDLEGVCLYFRDPRSVASTVSNACLRHLNGLVFVEVAARLDELRRCTPRDVAGAVGAGLAGVLVLLPEETPDVLPHLPLLGEFSHESVSGNVHRRRLRGAAPRSARLVHGQEGVSLCLPDGVLTVHYRDCVAVGRSDEHPHLELMAADGRTLVIYGPDWKDGEQIVSAVTQAVQGVETYPLALDDG